MKLLSAAEASDWLKQAGQIEDPYTTETDPPDHHLQFYAPTKYSNVEAFTRVFLSNFSLEEEILLRITDPYPLEGAKLHVFERLWTINGAPCSPENKPACLLKPHETEVAVALFTLTSCFWWKSYLYTVRDQLSLFNWEGEIWDIWTASEYKIGAVRDLVGSFRNSLTEHAKVEADLPFVVIPEE